MKDEKVNYNGELTGTIDQTKKEKPKFTQSIDEDFGASLDGIQQAFRVNPVDEEDYKGTIGYKDA